MEISGLEARYEIIFTTVTKIEHFVTAQLFNFNHVVDDKIIAKSCNYNLT